MVIFTWIWLTMKFYYEISYLLNNKKTLFVTRNIKVLINIDALLLICRLIVRKYTWGQFFPARRYLFSRIFLVSNRILPRYQNAIFKKCTILLKFCLKKKQQNMQERIRFPQFANGWFDVWIGLAAHRTRTYVRILKQPLCTQHHYIS